MEPKVFRSRQSIAKFVVVTGIEQILTLYCLTETSDNKTLHRNQIENNLMQNNIVMVLFK